MSNFLSTIRSGHVLRPYYYGSHKWDDYLVDIQETIAGLKISNSITAQEGSRTDELSFTLNDLSSSIEDLGAKFEWGLTLLIDGQERQIKLLNQIVGQLDAIREAVQLPSTTRARELFSLGQNDVRNGFLPEALKKFLAAEQINEVNFPLQLQMGKLLLYGKNATDDVIDLAKAEKHLLLAARYTGAEEKWRRYSGEAYFHAAIACYVASGQMRDEHAPGNIVIACLERAVIHANLSLEISPEFSGAYYLRAKCHALLGKKQEALADLEILADQDRRYLGKVKEDDDFCVFCVEAEQVFRNAVMSPGPNARIAETRLKETEEAVIRAKRSKPGLKDLAKIASATAYLGEIKQQLPGLDADIVGSLSTLNHIKDEVNTMTIYWSTGHIVDCDSDPNISNKYALVEHQKTGRVKLELHNNRLYANGSRIKACKRGDISGSSAVNACIANYLVKHPELMPSSWECWYTFFLGTKFLDPNKEVCFAYVLKGYPYVREGTLTGDSDEIRIARLMD